MPQFARHVVAVGGSSVVTAWGFDFLRAIAEAAPDHLTARTLEPHEEFDESAGAEEDRTFVMLGHVLGPFFRDFILDRRPPAIIFLDDPIDNARFQMSTGVNVVDALRTLTAAAAGFVSLNCSTSPNFLVIHRAIKGPARDIADSILAHLGIEIDAEKLDAVYDRFVGPDPDTPFEAALARKVEGYRTIEESESIVSPLDAEIVADVFTPIVQMILGKRETTIVWPTTVFLSGDKPNQPASLIAELTGAARFLFYGPYLYLPEGRWRARLMIGFTESAIGTNLTIDVFRDVVLMKGHVAVKDGGVYFAEFDFQHTRPEQPLQLRLSTERGAIEGQVALGRAELKWLGEPDV